MKNLNIDLGGHRFVGDDLLFLQSSLSEGLRAFIEGLGGSFFAISGVEITLTAGGTVINWTAGWIYMDGEFCQVDAGTAAYPANNTFQVVETNDPDGAAEYEDTSIVQTYKIRKAAISGNAGGTYAYYNMKYFKRYADWSAIVRLGTWAVPSGWPISPVVQKNAIGHMQLKGAVEVASYSNSTDTIICTLAAQFRPDQDRYLACAASVAGVKSCIVVHIDTNGNVRPLGLSNGQAVVVYLDSLYWQVA